MATTSGALALTTDLQTVAAAGAGVEGALFGLVFANGTAAERTITLSYYRQALGAAVELTFKLPANDRDAWEKTMALQPGDAVQVKADAAGVVLLWSYDEDAGAAPIATGFTGRGAWAAGATYAVNDVVEVAGSSFVSLQAGNLGNDPASSPAFWMLLAQRGAAGEVTEAELTAALVGKINKAGDTTTGRLNLHSASVPAVGLEGGNTLNFERDLFAFAVAANVTLFASNIPADFTPIGAEITVSNSAVITWPAAAVWKWAGGAGPTLANGKFYLSGYAMGGVVNILNVSGPIS